ncbi:MAG TPA: ferritin-like fold-containing protein [Demequina sp.]|nr:ferritin-like fold-containing protein [Cellulomonas sp.]HZL81428.1 ferritin-like fold-containing protein [Demequina sp.]
MTQTVQSGTSGTREDSIELLGLVAQLQLEAFTRSAEDSAVAPTLEQRLALSRFAADAVGRRDRVMDRIVEVGGDPLAAMAHFDHVLDDFDLRTSPSTWWERLLTSYVGYGVADDFCRIAAARLDESSRALVLDVLDDHSHADLAVAEIAAAGADDEVLVARLALWGRRLGGEALGVVQALLGSRPALLRIAAGTDVYIEAGEASGKLFGELTAEHTHRMGRLGLTA